MFFSKLSSKKRLSVQKQNPAMENRYFLTIQIRSSRYSQYPNSEISNLAHNVPQVGMPCPRHWDTGLLCGHSNNSVEWVLIKLECYFITSF